MSIKPMTFKPVFALPLTPRKQLQWNS